MPYGVGNLASYNTSVISLKFYIAWDVNLNPGPSISTNQPGCLNHRTSPAVNGQSKSFSSAV